MLIVLSADFTDAWRSPGSRRCGAARRGAAAFSLLKGLDWEEALVLAESRGADRAVVRRPSTARGTGVRSGQPRPGSALIVIVLRLDGVHRPARLPRCPIRMPNCGGSSLGAAMPRASSGRRWRWAIAERWRSRLTRCSTNRNTRLPAELPVPDAVRRILAAEPSTSPRGGAARRQEVHRLGRRGGLPHVFRHQPQLDRARPVPVGDRHSARQLVWQFARGRRSRRRSRRVLCA